MTDEHWLVVILVILAQFTTGNISESKANFKELFAIGSEAVMLLDQMKMSVDLFRTPKLLFFFF